MAKYSDSMISLWDAVDKLFDTVSFDSCSTGFYYTPNFPTTNYSWSTSGTMIPKVDIPHYPVSNGYLKEDGSMYLTFAVTGFDKSELIVKVEDTMLIVEGKLKEKQDTSKWKELFHNLSIRDFIWKTRISNKYNLEKLKAKIDKGILEISIPLKEECKLVKKEFEIK